MHECRNCRYYAPVYVRSTFCFWRQAAGYCSQRKAVVQRNSQCERYKHRQCRGKRATVEHIEIALADVHELEKMFFDYD